MGHCAVVHVEVHNHRAARSQPNLHESKMRMMKLLVEDWMQASRGLRNGLQKSNNKFQHHSFESGG